MCICAGVLLAHVSDKQELGTIVWPVLAPITVACFRACVLWTWYFIELHVWESLGSTLGNSDHFWVFFVLVFSRNSVYFSSVHSSCLVVSDSLQPHGLQHPRPPCPSPTARAYLNPCPLSWWCHPTISSSVIPFSSCPQSFPPSGSFQMSQLFISGGQRIGFSASTSVLPMNIQDWSPLDWTGWISLQSKGLSRVFSNAIVQKHQFFSTELSL